MRSAAVCTLTSAGCAHAPGTGLAVKKPWTIEVATTFTKRTNSPSRTANCDLSSLASYASTRGSPSFVSAGSYLAPRSMATWPLAPSRASQRTRIGTAGGPSLPLGYIREARFSGDGRNGEGQRRDRAQDGDARAKAVVEMFHRLRCSQAKSAPPQVCGRPEGPASAPLAGGLGARAFRLNKVERACYLPHG